jgi:hypothetical protein
MNQRLPVKTKTMTKPENKPTPKLWRCRSGFPKIAMPAKSIDPVKREEV